MIRRNIPNLITLLNLISGLAGIVFIMRGKVEISIGMIFAAAVFDFLDGTAARLLKAYSDIGKSLDSLADLVSFGVLPAMMVYNIGMQSLNFSYYDYVIFAVLLIPIFAAIRLAIFNNDETQKDYFRGVPVPANALFIAVLTKIFWFEPESFIYLGPPVYFALAIMFSGLQVVMIPFLSLKFTSLKFRENFRRYLLIILSLIMIIFWKWEGILFSILTYLIISASLLFPSRIKS